jgi:hypothetical protein
MRRLLPTTLSSITCAFVCAAALHASSLAVQIVPSVTLNANGIFTYSYSLSNLATSSKDVFAFTLEQIEPIPSASVVSPAEWIADLSDGTDIVWTATAHPLDVAPNTTLSGFAFQSDNAPGQIVFASFGSDQLSGFPTGDLTSGFTAGPFAATPEPGSICFLCCGLFLLRPYRVWKEFTAMLKLARK